MVAKAKAEGEKEPSYENFSREMRLSVLEVGGSSSLVGPSTATLAAATGLPYTPQIDVENSGQILWPGDRVSLGLRRVGAQIEFLFSGYCVSSGIAIDPESESMTYRIVGPEWVWGDGSPATGAQWQVLGQFRRKAAADDAWVKNPERITRYADWDAFYGMPAVLNPEGRANMTQGEVELTAPGQKKVIGRIWEIPDRRVNGTPRAERWNILQAVKMLCTQYNPYKFSGIEIPDFDSDTSGIPFTDKDVMPETDLTGLGLWEALRRVLGPKYYFSVDPVPTIGRWGGFKLQFHSRSSGPAADFRLNARGTPMRKAVASVVRLESTRNIGATVNRVIVQGRDVKQIRLVYWGPQTNTLQSRLKKIALQQGWNGADGNLSSYAASDGFQIGVSPLSLDVLGEVKRKEWTQRYVTSGELHTKYLDVFRRFAWNEGGELPDTWTSQYGAAVNVKVFTPDLTEIADGPGEARGLYTRRPRKMLDSLMLRNPKVSQFERIRPTLYMALSANAGSGTFDALKWVKVPDAAYDLDPLRCAFRITVDDPANWKPFEKQDVPGGQTGQNDIRSYASLLYQGVLRFCLEFSIETDYDFSGWAGRTDDSGSVMLRERVYSMPESFIRATAYNDGLYSPTGLDPFVVDMTKEIQDASERIRSGSQDQQVHASILTSGDWERQKIGSMVHAITGGRYIDMECGSGRGAQIVAYKIDPRSFKYQYLTESAALELNKRNRELLGSTRLFYGRRKR